jgi:hypothetical protein
MILQKQISLRKELKMDFGMQEKDKSTKTDQPVSEQLRPESEKYMLFCALLWIG